MQEFLTLVMHAWPVSSDRNRSCRETCMAFTRLVSWLRAPSQPFFHVENDFRGRNWQKLTTFSKIDFSSSDLCNGFKKIIVITAEKPRKYLTLKKKLQKLYYAMKTFQTFRLWMLIRLWITVRGIAISSAQRSPSCSIYQRFFSFHKRHWNLWVA